MKSVVVATATPRGPAPRARGPRAARAAAPPAADVVSSLEAALAAPPAPSRAPTAPMVAGDGFESTPGQVAVVATAGALLATLFGAAASDAATPTDAAALVAAVVAGYYAADFGTAVYHWSVDNYGSASTPIVGGQIEAFQGHHLKPWTITQRQFANNVHKIFAPSIPVTLLGLALAPLTPGWADAFGATVVGLACMSQQFHAWAHAKKSDLPPLVLAAQDAGLLISRKAHGAHHRAPFEGNYAIVSGAWNAALDAGGDASFFRTLERAVAAATGVEPRCWHDPEDYDFFPPEEVWEEEAAAVVEA